MTNIKEPNFKKAILIPLSPILVIFYFAIEEAVKSFEWFKELVGMLEILIENIGEIGLATTTVIFVVLWVKWSNEDIKLRLKNLESNNYQDNKLDDENKKGHIKTETSADKFKDLRFAVEMVRFSSYTKMDTSKIQNKEGLINSFLATLNNERALVKDMLIKKYNYRGKDADAIINEYYRNYK